MNTKKLAGIATLAALMTITACGGGGSESTPSGPPGASASAPAGDAGKSKAKLITASDITLGDIDMGLAEKGRNIYDVKCQACHSLGKNRVVGPGFKGIMENRKPEWIMNMILNIDVMLETDDEAQRLLEECLVRMPNQGLSKEEGRQVLEFLRTV